MTNKQLLEQLGINCKNNNGQFKTTCPQCSGTRKNKNEPCLSVNVQEGVYTCHNCGWHGRVWEPEQKVFVKPEPRLEKLGPDALKFFEEGRKISNNTLLRFGVTQAIEWMPTTGAEMPVICFNYLLGGETINIKFRGKNKAFKMAKDAKLILYNLDSLEKEHTAIICEGEIDALSFHESGIYNVVSVPNGAGKGNNDLKYIGNSYQQIKDIKTFIIAVDNDSAGESLKEDLATRLGKDRCMIVEYPEGCKDANEVLCKYGKDAVRELIETAKPYPLDGIVTVDDVFDEVIDIYENGYPKGARTYIPGFDDLLSFSSNQLTIITGIPGHGKDEFGNEIFVSLARMEGWKFGMWGFEEEVKLTVTKLIAKYCKKSFDFRKDPEKRLTRPELERAAVFIDDHFKFLNVRSVEPTVNAILEKAKQMKTHFGINAFVINPWACLSIEKTNGSATEDIREELTKITNFGVIHDIHMFVVAHPAKMKREGNVPGIPTLYDVSGSAHFFNLTHNGITVYRDFELNQTRVIVQKVKHEWLGSKGEVCFIYDGETRQYLYASHDVIDGKFRKDHQENKLPTTGQYKLI